jgi:hypothetical protein
LKLLKPNERILLVTSQSASELGRAFVRPAEFFESPSKWFRRRFFTLDQFKKWYCRTQSTSGKFTYYSDYFGWNIPGDAFLDWQAAYAGSENEDESNLVALLGALPDKFYLIGAGAGNLATINHELAHAFFHLYAVYREQMTSLMRGHDFSGVYRYLKGNMYSPDVFLDEAHAYTMFDGRLMNRQGVKTAHLNDLRDKMVSLFRAWEHMYLLPRREW